MHAGFEQVGPVPTAHWLLWRMRLFSIPPVNESKTTPKELAPDSTIERRDGYIATWHFAGTADLLMVCAYDGSGTYYQARPRPLPSSCTAVDADGLMQAWCRQP